LGIAKVLLLKIRCEFRCQDDRITVLTAALNHRTCVRNAGPVFIFRPWSHSVDWKKRAQQVHLC